MKKHKSSIIYCLCVILSIAFIFFSNRYIMKNGDFNINKGKNIVVRATVTSVMDKKTDTSDIGSTDYIPFTAVIKGGSMDGAEVSATQVNDIHMAIKMKEVEVNDKIILSYIETSGVDGYWVLGEYERTGTLSIMALVFIVFLLAYGRIKGLSTVLSLIFTCLSVFIVLIPAVIGCLNIYFWTIIVCSFIIVMTIVIVNGISVKSLVAAAGCFTGVMTCGALTQIMNKFLHLTGAIDSDATFLLLMHENNQIDLNAIIFAGIVIGAVGAIMDVSISMSSALYEVKCQAANPTMGSLMQSGLNIGRDILGTMSNTLILAYIGSSLSTVLLLIGYNTSYLQLLNREMIVVEILQMLTGSFGILLTVPFTTFFASLLFTKKCTSKE